MTGVTNTNPAIVTANFSVADGDLVILTQTTGMSQISGMTFTASSPVSNSFTLLGLDASSFSQPATNVVVIFTSPKIVQPQYLYITGILRGPVTIVTVSTIHNYIPNQLVKFNIPSSYGFQGGNQVTSQILSVTDYTMTLALDSQLFDAFSFPPNVKNYIIPLFATLSPVGGRNEYDTLTIPFH